MAAACWLWHSPSPDRIRSFIFLILPAKCRRVTRDTNAYIDLSLAADGHTMATVERQTHNNVYVLPDGASSSQARAVHDGGFPELRSWMDAEWSTADVWRWEAVPRCSIPTPA